MKYLIILTLLLCSCGVQHNINKAKKHTQKAIDKGAVFNVSKDTLIVNDTIISERTFTRNDTVFIERTKTIEKVITQNGEIRYITKKDKRIEVKAEKVEAKREFKLAKIEHKTDRIKVRKEKKRSFWILWLSLGILIGLIANKYLRQLKSILL